MSYIINRFKNHRTIPTEGQGKTGGCFSVTTCRQPVDRTGTAVTATAPRQILVDERTRDECPHMYYTYSSAIKGDPK